MTMWTAPRNGFQRLFDWKVHGIRWVEIIGLLLVAIMIFSVYVAKAGAAREGVRISQLDREIDDNGERVRLLRAEVARLEQPGRLEALSRSAGLAPVDVHRRTSEESLAAIAPVPEPRPVIIAPTTAAAVDAAAAESPVVPGPEAGR
ncbi:cell division protein [uncultured Brevundimonas sp.]|uniref:cell division protein FtsL n=1 Tax=uncultured Brevundimonas sp. TaxID=213418 RepID=UPI0030EE8794|tara:strand:+ start:103 stop:543 length:441 start_codon:yes stop_codon:yes gene_type:complete